MEHRLSAGTDNTLESHHLDDLTSWPDAWLIAAACEDPGAREALDVLVNRYWKLLNCWCRKLTMDNDHAADLAQETWTRVLRARASLRADRNFRGFIIRIATNIWRDQRRSSRRAGALAEHRLVALDAALPGEEDDALVLADVVPDPMALSPDAQIALRLDLDRVLAELPPRLRDVILARHVAGESATEIGRRYGCTEQTVTSWLRRAAHLIEGGLSETRRAA